MSNFIARTEPMKFCNSCLNIKSCTYSEWPNNRIEMIVKSVAKNPGRYDCLVQIRLFCSDTIFRRPREPTLILKLYLRRARTFYNGRIKTQIWEIFVTRHKCKKKIGCKSSRTARFVWRRKMLKEACLQFIIFLYLLVVIK